MHKKLIFAGLGLVLLASPVLASAQSVDVQAQINALLAMIKQLQAQLAQLQEQPNSSGFCYAFNKDLKFGDSMTGKYGTNDTEWLQKVLAQEGYVIDKTENNGASIAKFGVSTTAAVKRFQAKYGIPQTGYVGPLTRAQLNHLYGCKPAPMYVPFPTEQEMAEARIKGRDARRVSDVKQLQLALELYYDSVGFYPTGLSVLAPEYIAAIPSDTLDRMSYAYDQLDGGKGYELGASLEMRNAALFSDQDAAASQGNLWTGSDLVGCRNEPNRYCYDVGEYSTSSVIPSITITYPNGGEYLNFESGKDVDLRINWESSNVHGNVTAYLQFADGRTCNLGTVTVFSRTMGNYLGSNYRCANTVITDGQYKVLLVADVDQRIRDESNGFFTVTNAPSTKPVITSTSAKAAANFEADAGGEISVHGSNLATIDSTRVYIGGLPATVTWTSDAMVSEKVPSTLTPGITYDLYIANDYGVSNTIRVKVLSSLYQPFTVTFPRPGAQLYAGQTYTISWTGSDEGVRSYAVKLMGGMPYGSINRSLGTAYSSGLQGGTFVWAIPQDLAGGNYQNYQISFEGIESSAGHATATFGIGFCSSYCY